MTTNSSKESDVRTIDQIGCTFSDCDLSQRVFEGVLFNHALFENVDLSDSSFIGVSLNEAIFRNCNLQGVKLLYCHLENTQFISCTLDDLRSIGSSLDRLQVYDRHSLYPTRPSSIKFIYALGYLYEVYHWPALETSSDSLESSTSKPLILLHGMTGHALDFQKLVDRLDRPLYAINLLGHGSTGFTSLSSAAVQFEGQVVERKPPSYEEVAQHTQSVIEQLLHLGQHSTFDLLGYSMGGRLALYLGSIFQKQKSSSKLEQLYVISAALGIECQEDRRQRIEFDRQWSDRLWEENDLESFLTTWNAQPLLKRVLDNAPKEADRIHTYRSTHQTKGLAMAFDALGQGQMPSLREIVKNSVIKTIFIAGIEDQKYVDFSTEAVRLNPKYGRFIGIDNCGHTPHLENFGAFWQRLAQQLKLS